MANFPKLPIILLLSSLLLINITVSSDPPLNSPAPSPTAASPPPAPVPAPNDAPNPPPGESPADDAPTPAPGNSPASGPVGESDGGAVKNLKAGSEERESGGMSGGKKAGIALGVMGAVFVAAAGTVVYKKRQRNLQRAEYGYNARRDIL